MLTLCGCLCNGLATADALLLRYGADAIFQFKARGAAVARAKVKSRTKHSPVCFRRGRNGKALSDD